MNVNKKKIIVVDDSAFMRKLIGDMIEEHERLEVIARLRNGQELIDQIDKLDPDLITLDVEMPLKNGLDTLKELNKKRKKYKVIMISSLTYEGSRMTIECLINGAIDFIQKPSGSISLDMEKVKDEMINKIVSILNVEANIKNLSLAHTTIKQNNVFNALEKNKEESNKFKADAIVIGASTGGPKAIQTVLTSLDKLDLPILVVQHMPKGFTKAFADRLNKITKFNVIEIEDGMKIDKNNVYIAKGGYHFEITRDRRIKLVDGKPLWGVMPAVDKLFSTAAIAYNGKIISAVLTGMGKDGAKGSEIIKDYGGITLAEDKSTCVIYGMPKVAYETGKIDYVVPLHDIGDKINSLVRGK